MRKPVFLAFLIRLLPEHLSPGRADGFVADLCRLAPLVLFSAAIPHQGGDHHVNEQWQSYWAERFGALSYRPIDLVRPAIWKDERIPWFYRQNYLLYADAKAFETLAGRLTCPVGDAVAPDIVHRIQFEKLAAERPGVKESLAVAARLPLTIAEAVRRKLS